MMAKIVQGNSFSNAVNYVLNREESSIIATKGVRNIDKESIIRSFETQARLVQIAKPVAHISLDFSAQDRAKMTSEKMIEIADEYMKKMGYGNTQVLMVRHTDRDHPHVHLIMNRIDFNGKRISDQNERFRSTKICKELTLKHGLYVSSGKENVKRERLREPDATKYRIYDALVKHVAQSRSWKELQKRLRSEGIELGFKTKGSTSQIEGVRFTMNNLSFNGSKVDRQFSYSKIDYTLRQNNRAEQQSLPLVQQPLHRPEHHESNTIGDSIGSLFDMPILPNGTDPEEEAFRRQMQRKKKKNKQRFKL